MAIRYRTYGSGKAKRVYFDVVTPVEARCTILPAEIERTAAYIEAVLPDGKAFVVKSRYGERGPITKTTERRQSHVE